jgi:large subunit ribosomal protein L25
MDVTLQATSRELSGKKVGKLRREGLIPAVLAGRDQASRPILVNELEYSRVGRGLSPTTLIDLVLDGSPAGKALLHNVQIDPRSQRALHLELMAVRMDEEIKADIPLHVEGSSPAVTVEGGTLVVAHSTVQIRCNADHLVAALSVDVSGLTTFHDHITAGDLTIPEGVELLTDPSVILVSITPPRVQEPTEVPETAGEGEAAAAV